LQLTNLLVPNSMSSQSSLVLRSTGNWLSVMTTLEELWKIEPSFGPRISTRDFVDVCYSLLENTSVEVVEFAKSIEDWSMYADLVEGRQLSFILSTSFYCYFFSGSQELESSWVLVELAKALLSNSLTTQLTRPNKNLAK
jgi:hypothetical protein